MARKFLGNVPFCRSRVIRKLGEFSEVFAVISNVTLYFYRVVYLTELYNKI